MSERTAPPIDFDREAIEHARRLTVEQRLALGGDLFDSACEVTLNFIHVQNPGISREQALDILRQRLEFGRRLEAQGVTSNDIVLRVVAALEAAAIPYMLVGSYSSNAFGVPRLTQDADFVIEAGDRPLTPLFDALCPDIRFDPQMQVEMVTMTYRYIATHPDSGFKIEMFLVSDDPHDRARFERRKLQPFLGATAILPTPEDVIIQKLRWFARARREKDWNDARAVIGVQRSTLDLDYIRHWCDQHGTRELIDRALASLPSI